MKLTLRVELEPERVDKVLAAELAGVSRAAVQRWLEEGRVLLDGRALRRSDRVEGGMTLDVDPGPPPPSEVVPDARVPFEVLHEDAELLVVVKPAGVVVHPGRGHWEGTLVSGLLARPGFDRATFDPRDPLGPLRPGIVHRLDKDTSGVLVVAKSARAREGLKDALARHDVERVYLGVTLGVPRPGRIETLHGRSPTARRRFSSRVLEGRRAVTTVQVVEPLAGGRAALVRCTLETGRTHQIRVHLSEQAGAPIFADPLYGRTPADPELAPLSSGLGRHALHASVLGFTHPVTGVGLRFEAPPPPELEALIAALRALGPGYRR